MGAGKVWVSAQPRRRRMADRARAAAGHAVDRRRRRRRVHRLRRGRGVDRQLHRRNGLADRPPHERGHPRPGRRRPGARGGRRRGMGQHRGPARGGHPAGIRLRRRWSRVTEQPDVVIASDLPLQGPDGAGPRAMADAIRLALEQRDFKAGRYTVGYRSCDDVDGADRRLREAPVRGERGSVRGRGRPRGRDRPVQLLLRRGGDPDPEPRTGRAARDDQPHEHGPRTHPQAGPRHRTASAGEPEVYYPTGVRNYVRLLPGDDLQGAALAVLAKRLALERVYLLHDRASFWKGLLTDPFRRAAARLGVGLAGSAAFDPRTKSYRVLADTVARSGADGVVVGGDPSYGGDRLVKALRARLGAGVTLMGGFFFTPRLVVKRIGRAGHGMYVTTADLPRGILPLGAAGRRFERDIGDPATEYRGGHGVRAGRGSRDGRDRSLRRDARLGAPRAVRQRCEGRHPRHLPLRPQRRHHDGLDPDPPRHRRDPAGREPPAATSRARRSTASCRSRRSS